MLTSQLGLAISHPWTIFCDVIGNLKYIEINPEQDLKQNIQGYIENTTEHLSNGNGKLGLQNVRNYKKARRTFE